ncbi:MAG: helix-turn-helix domain-containing protein [Saccharofermentanales bacterium]|jgi:AraC-like DNA-binding protein|nr:AraC family transcriptional regulator [Clostridiaceae bacterium]
MAYLENREYPDKMPVTAAMFRNINFLAHWHTEVEFVLVKEGSLGLGLNSGYHVLEAGDMAMLGHGDIHYYDSKDRDSTVLIIVFRPEMLRGLMDIDQMTLANTIISRKTCNNDFDRVAADGLRDCFNVIYHEINNKGNAYETIVRGRLAELSSRFLRICPESSANLESGLLGHGSKRLLQKAIRYINENYEQEITLNDISSHLNISPFYFSRLFSMSIGLTFKRYLNTLRVDKAHRLITASNRPITEIAFECGFNSIRTFNRVFSEIRGSTPSSLRQAAAADLTAER